jgi:HPt (histidine-containing phosphotransfer) domain-containing protein
MEPSAETMINLQFLENFTGNDVARIRKYILMFLDSAPSEMEVIRKSLQEKNWDALRAGAHSLKPQMIYMGIKGGEELLKSIEQHAGDATDLEKLPVMVEELDKIFVKSCDELNTYLKQSA